MYILEGNIGVGKSTFLEQIKKNLPEIQILTEPKDNWTQQIFGQSLLENFYKNPQRWAYTLETLAMICRAKDHIKEQNQKNGNVLIERSVYSGHYCFAINGHQNGYFTQIEWNIYNKWANFILTNQCKPPKGFIYLKATPQICIERIKKRGRMSEKSLTMAYLKQIHYWHEKFLIKKDNITETIKNVPVLILNCNQNFIQNQQILLEHLVKTKNFIEKTTLTKQLNTVIKDKDIGLTI
ncbi:deoxynucleoside kinase [Candidatus Babeliales bacterium]|nr:deoxynucleoside kinase [Candidatus Babeliales bacterium]